MLHVDDAAALDVKNAGDSAVGVYFIPGEHPHGAGRNYSVRYHDGSRITLDVVLHSSGPGTGWASSASKGDRVVLDHARSWYRPPPDTDWQLLVSDLSGLPAAARIIEELAEPARATLLIEVATDEDLRYLPHRPNVKVISTVGTGNGHAPSTLADAVRAFDMPDGPGYCWFAGEAADSRAVRKYLRSLGWTIDRYDITGYWRFDSENWDARFAEVESDVFAVYEWALTEGKGDKMAFEEFDEACERIGL